MGKLRGLHNLVNNLPPGFSIDAKTGILYYSDNSTTENRPERIGKVCNPEDKHYSFFIRFDEFGKERYEHYRKYWASLNEAFAGKKIAGGFVLMNAPVPRL